MKEPYRKGFKKADLQRTLDEMELSMGISSAKCPYSGAVHIASEFSGLIAFRTKSFSMSTHYGWMSLIGAQCVGAAGRVIAFEPAPPLFDILRYHKRVNRLKQMEVVVSAVSDMDRESVPFFVMNNGFSVGNSHTSWKDQRGNLRCGR